MRWDVHGERDIYDSPWMRMVLVDVEPPGGDRFDHHLVRFPQPAAGVIVHDPDRGILLLWRHRFSTDTWGWEVPAGRVDAGEAIDVAARREVLEETGWRCGPVEHLMTFHPASGVTDLAFHVFLAHAATRAGEPVDVHEAERVEWLPVEQVRAELAAGRVLDGLSVAGLAFAFALGHLDVAPRSS
jgi:8-oxo-dGTP pyrophosphatase MutT (NUDIX family)